MKKAILIGLLLALLIIPVAIAGERHNLDFSDGKPKFITVPVRDIVSFNYTVRQYYEPQVIDNQDVYQFEYFTHEQAIMVSEINETKGILFAKMVVFIEDSELPYYTTVRSRDSIRLDFEFDEVEEMVVQILSIDKEKGVTMLLAPLEPEGEYTPHVFKLGKAKPIVTSGNEENGITGKIISYVNNGTGTKIIGAIIIILVILIILKRPIQKVIVKGRNQKLRTEGMKKEEIVTETVEEDNQKSDL